MVTRFVTGFTIGLIVGSAAVLLTTPHSGAELLESAKSWMDGVLEEGRKAKEQSRADLEARIVNLTTGGN